MTRQEFAGSFVLLTLSVKMSKLLKKQLSGIALAGFLMLNSCTPCVREWTYQEVRASCSSDHSKRIILFPENPYRGIGLQFLRTHSGQFAYLDVYSLSLPQDPLEPKTAMVTFSSEGDSLEFKVYRFEGGQRLLLSKDAECYLIDKLLECHRVKITVGRFRDEITPREFHKVYTKFCYAP